MASYTGILRKEEEFVGANNIIISDNKMSNKFCSAIESVSGIECAEEIMCARYH